MTDDCSELRLLVQADADGELSASDAARVRAHVDRCPACETLQAQLAALSARVGREAARHEAPDGLRTALQERLAALSPPAPSPRRARAWAPFGAGFALAACLALALLPFHRDEDLAATVVSDHVRALQPGHLMDVASTDRHTVKPWFDGRLDFAPPVKDLQADGFPLAGGRLDYLADHPAAVLVYGRRLHLIDLYVWPAGADPGPAEGSRNGYNFLRWTRDGMAFWAVSDLAADELADFARLWQAG